MTELTQEEINELEWKNPENWAGDIWFGVYFSKQDSRAFVPKREHPELGWTFNLGNPQGVKFLYSILVGVPSILALTLTIVVLLALCN